LVSGGLGESVGKYRYDTDQFPCCWVVAQVVPSGAWAVKLTCTSPYGAIVVSSCFGDYSADFTSMAIHYQASSWWHPSKYCHLRCVSVGENYVRSIATLDAAASQAQPSHSCCCAMNRSLRNFGQICQLRAQSTGAALLWEGKTLSTRRREE
jgi:hypothetical protein